MVNHGLVMGPILFIVALLGRRAGGSEDIREMGGIAFRAPVLASLALIVTLATLAMPGSSNFVGEFLILLGLFKAKLVFAIIAFSGVVMASVYALRLFIRAMHNRVGERVSSREISPRDALVLVPLVLVIVFFAVYPQLALHRSEGSVKSDIASVHAALAKPAGEGAPLASTGHGAAGTPAVETGGGEATGGGGEAAAGGEEAATGEQPASGESAHGEAQARGGE
jgi:NADH:ubiquinone oxidoreductase subunit 4 (subunit M)